MHRAIVATALLLAGVLCAHAAHPDDSYHDLRPNGYKRSDAAFQADVSACQRLTHDSRYRPDSTAMKRCMLGRGYRWQSTTWIEDRPAAPSRGRPLDWYDFLKWEQ